ncbi:hypothetical protein Sme01_35660 [Sphaerisporangium melleum]|uniref:DUF3147 family protein n=1 Tax=Sphaerisporangium melleum TaxID=321316 RepID=A0A917VMV4_9ACTN|nr:DUF3147 family protein [Sphaerisporangium melleum]GGK97223.1 hypothetical protein GCM10007964_44310 [Sphaerisporangium melleum]GII71090.1 hypothetical protein Sme01_35660 [Sphaerisporangium melleum]
MNRPGGIRIRPGKIREVSPVGLALRFAFGLAVSVVAGLVGTVWGEQAGGVFLAFPAVMAATLTLIEDEERSRVPVVQDARGAVLGAVGMIAFAACVWLLVLLIPAPLAMVVATVVWGAVSIALYLIVHNRRASR